MAKASKFTDEQKLEIALELLAGKFSHAEICRKWDIRRTENQEVEYQVNRKSGKSVEDGRLAFFGR